MKFNDIKDALDQLGSISQSLEDLYIEGGGEVTPETEKLETERAALTALLTGEGVDNLGRWLKRKEDELATYQAEKALAERKIKSVKNTIEFIKYEVGQILRQTQQEKVKGAFYSFAQYDSTKQTVDTEHLENEYLEAATEAARNAGLPDFCDIAIVTNVKRITGYAAENGDEGLEYIIKESTPTCKYIKPAKAKESVQE